MNRWQDPRMGTYKSALQKAIRRGETSNARSAAMWLGGLPRGTRALAKRLSVIAAEDVGAVWLPAVVVITRETGDGTADLERLAALADSLSQLPKQKEAYWLAATCWDGRLVVKDPSPAQFSEALEQGDHRLSVATYIAAHEIRQWRSGLRLISVLEAKLRSGPLLTQAIGSAALWREAGGGSGSHELVSAAVIAAIDQPDGPVPDLPLPVGGRANIASRLSWDIFDGHTLIGERALGRVARQRGLAGRHLADLMFNCESIRLGPTEEPARWKELALALDAQAGGWRTDAEGLRLWANLRDLVKDQIELGISEYQEANAGAPSLV